MWQVKIHRLVLKEDFRKLSLKQRQHILAVIKKKLSLAPEVYGKPLSGEFSGYWRLRVEDFRVIYRIVKDKIQVLVIKVGIRRDAKVYETLFARLKKANFI
ncbi:MAG: type II toxin-antitoxin system RelE/ParE family toxin [Candidatus Omnitrophica bacterium]|nr:type II toxin-antitoxin system RelE/ParE family toxin [Candidatus Omnitrophota bacterium]